MRSILVNAEYKLENHNVNGDETGNPKEVDDRVYISGQKLRYSIIKRMEDNVIGGDVNDKFSPGDAPTGDIVNDWSSDFRGFMVTEKGENSKVRKSPIDTCFSIAKNKSDLFDDLFTRFDSFKKDNGDKQRINEKTYSHRDIMPVTFTLNVPMLSCIKKYNIDDNKFISERRILLISNEEKVNRVIEFIKATNGLSGLANTSRNAVDNTPRKFFIAFNDREEFKKYYEMCEKEQTVFRKDLDRRKIVYFEGDVLGETGMTVNEAVDKACDYVKNNPELVETLTYNKKIVKQYA